MVDRIGVRLKVTRKVVLAVAATVAFAAAT
jgi:hypothetical protein